MNTKGFGLQPLKEDTRDIQLGALYSLPKLSELPTDYILPLRPVKNQGSTDFCTAYSSCLASEYQEDKELEPSFSFMASKIISGDPDAWGQDLRNAAASHTKYGALPKAASPFSLETKSSDFLRRENWPLSSLLSSSAVHKKASYMFVSGQYSPFDNIRATLWKFRNEKRAVVFGTIWDSSWDTSQYVFDKIPVNGVGHAMTIIGFTWKNGNPYLVVQNSFGDNNHQGRHLFSRDIINAMVPRYGAFMFQDLTPEQAKQYLSANIKADQNLLVKKLAILIEMLKQFIGMKQLEVKKNSMTPTELLYETATSFLGKDVTPKDEVDDDVACAVSVNAVFKAAFGREIGGGASTAAMYRAIKADYRFKKTMIPSKGLIIISPTHYGNGSIKGHVGIFGENETIMSNTSEDGIWRSNLTLASWVKRYRNKGDMPILFYQVIA